MSFLKLRNCATATKNRNPITFYSFRRSFFTQQQQQQQQVQNNNIITKTSLECGTTTSKSKQNVFSTTNISKTFLTCGKFQQQKTNFFQQKRTFTSENTNTPKINAFSILNQPVKFQINHNDIEQEFRKQQMKYHPDQQIQNNNNDTDIEQKSSQLNEAIKILRNPVSRAEHLLALRGRSPLQDENSTCFGNFFSNLICSL